MTWLAHDVERVVGGIATALCSTWAVLHISRHVRYNKMELWKCTVRILAIVPIYAIDAWSCLMLEDTSLHLATLLTFARQVYESMAMYSFLEFVLTFLGGPERLAERLQMDGQAPVEHIWLLRQVKPPYKPGPGFVVAVVVGILQYSAVMLIILPVDIFIWNLDGTRMVKWFQLLVQVTRSLSCMWAMYNLVLLYQETRKWLSPIQPVLKFMSIKGIVFFTFWQDLVVWALAKADVIPCNPERPASNIWSQSEIADGIKNLLLCLEMLVFSEMHRRAYPYYDLQEGEDDMQEMQHLIADDAEDIGSSSQSLHRCCRPTACAGVHQLLQGVVRLWKRAEVQDIELEGY